MPLYFPPTAPRNARASQPARQPSSQPAEQPASRRSPALTAHLCRRFTAAAGGERRCDVMTSSYKDERRYVLEGRHSRGYLELVAFKGLVEAAHPPPSALLSASI